MCIIDGTVENMDNENNTSHSNNHNNINYNGNSDINNNNGNNDNNNNNNYIDHNRNGNNGNGGGSENGDHRNSNNSENNTNENRGDLEDQEDNGEMNNNNDENNDNTSNNGNEENNSSVDEDNVEVDDESINTNSHHEKSTISVRCNDTSNENNESSIKTYLINKFTFTDNEFDKSDSRLIVNNLSILSNTPYDSIEAQNKHNCNSHPENQNHINFKVNDLDHNNKVVLTKENNENFVELINIKTGSLSDEFSGTESMEYIHYAENDKLLKEKENWYTNLITITQDLPDESNCRTKTTETIVDSMSSYHTTESPDTSEVHVITGNDTLSAVICLEEGLADDDSWVEELDRDDFSGEESSENEEISFMEREEDIRRFNRCEIDFTLHTIVEESGEESENETDNDKVNPTELEKYFVFEIGGSDSNTQHQNNDLDSVSESSSTLSESLEIVNTQQTVKIETDPSDLAPSRLEKYFLSGFMGFNKRDSDGSVGSDSEGKHSPEQRRKKLVRARGTNRHNSLDNLNEEQQVGSESQSENSSSDNECAEENTSFDKSDGQFDTVKRTKKKKRSIVMSSIEHLENCENLTTENKKTEMENIENTIAEGQKKENISISNDLSATKELNITNKLDLPEGKNEPIKSVLTFTSNEGLSRKDSFNNWSSDEETNLMMSKMRTFFKSMIANQRKNASPIIKNRNKPPQLVYFESELTRLMKTIPGLRDDQVKEIVEYLSSEDTWSDSYDSSDYTSSDLEVGTKKHPFQENISEDYCKVPDINQDAIKKNSDLVYQCLMSSFQPTDLATDTTSDSSVSRNSPPLMNKVMQHIGTRLVALMHEVSEGSATTPKVGKYHRRMQPKLPTICTTTEEEDDSIEECSPLPRSKSYDPLLEESRQETSDNERFSWRGSFESALMTGSDSRTRLPSTGENSASALALAAAKRRSAGDLLFKSSNSSREQLDRVRSCGSIGGGVEDKIWSMRHARKRRSSVPDGASNSGESADGENDSDDDEDDNDDKTLTENLGKSTTLPRTLQTFSTSMTNSLPRLSSTVFPTPSIYKGNSSHQFTVKSARYRPPGYNCRTSSSNFATLCAPPRREYNRRRQAQQQNSPPPVSVSIVGPGDDCSVSSDISERAGILDNESEKSHSRISTVSVTRSDSMASVYSGAGEGRYGVVPVRGEVEFSLQYNYKAGDVEIHVKRCSDLAPVDVKRNRSDPYVKVYLLPDRSKGGKRKTRVKKHTLNPVFDEVLKYHVSLEELKSRTLWLSVWHSDIFGRNDFLGEISIPLENKVFDDPLPKSYVLRERTEVPDNVSTLKGELIVALKFVSPSENKLKKRLSKEIGSLQVLIKEAKNLTAIKSNGTSDPFCKSYLLPNKGRSCKQKTPVLKKTCHPVWNHTFVYNNVTLDEMSQRCLELTIWDHDRLASNEFLGCVRLSLGTGLCNDKSVDWMDSNNREVALWQRMIDHPNFWVESSLILRPSLDVRNKT